MLGGPDQFPHLLFDRRDSLRRPRDTEIGESLEHGGGTVFANDFRQTDPSRLAVGIRHCDRTSLVAVRALGHICPDAAIGRRTAIRGRIGQPSATGPSAVGRPEISGISR